MTAKVVEIFESVQGEGKYAGVRQVFVRFFECNMHCVWCDTPHSIGDTTRRYDEYTLDQLWEKITSLWSGCHSVSFTGGEPLLQAEFLKSFLPRLNEAGMPVYLETNGVLPQALEKVIDHVDIVSMDLKLPSSAKCQPYWDEHAAFLKIACDKDVFVKTVVSSETDSAEIIQSAALVADVDPSTPYFLQPNYFDRKNGVLDKCFDAQMKCVPYLNHVRVLPQVHKYMKIR